MFTNSVVMTEILRSDFNEGAESIIDLFRVLSAVVNQLGTQGVEEGDRRGVIVIKIALDR